MKPGSFYIVFDIATAMFVSLMDIFSVESMIRVHTDFEGPLLLSQKIFLLGKFLARG